MKLFSHFFNQLEEHVPEDDQILRSGVLGWAGRGPWAACQQAFCVVFGLSPALAPGRGDSCSLGPFTRSSIETPSFSSGTGTKKKWALEGPCDQVTVSGLLQEGPAEQHS